MTKKTVLITGCSSGIGRATAELFAQRGWQVADEEADRAMACLKEAVVKGQQDIEHLKKDDDLEALRDRADYRKLIQNWKRKD